MTVRRIDVFFYGLFMDEEMLLSKGIRPGSVRPAVVEDYSLRIGRRATLVPQAGGRVHGVLMSLTHDDIERLYSDPSVSGYRPEGVLAWPAGGGGVAALCFNLVEPLLPEEPDPEYAEKLRVVAERIGLPEDYVASIR